MTNRKAQARRLERAGFVFLSGWVPAAIAARLRACIEEWREDAEQIAQEPPMPRGRPRKRERG